jgi:hypothetical protein
MGKKYSFSLLLANAIYELLRNWNLFLCSLFTCMLQGENDLPQAAKPSRPPLYFVARAGGRAAWFAAEN